MSHADSCKVCNAIANYEIDIYQLYMDKLNITREQAIKSLDQYQFGNMSQGYRHCMVIQEKDLPELED